MILTVLSVVAIVLSITLYNLNDILLTGAAFLAKRTCSCYYLQGRSSVVEEFAIPLLKYLPFRVVHNEQERSFSSTVLGFRVVTAYFHGDEFGCVLHRKEPFTCKLDNAVAINEPFAQYEPIPALERLIDAEFAHVLPNGEPRNVRAIVVMRHGEILAERYRAPFTESTRQAGWSMTKSLLNTLIGERGLELERFAFFPNGTQSTRIRLGHLLNMTSGLAWDENYGTDGLRFGDPTHMLFNERDLASFVAARDMAHEPGTYWHYSSGDTNLLAFNLARTFDSPCAFYEWMRGVWRRRGLHSVVVELDAVGLPVFSSFGWATARDWARWAHNVMHLPFTKRTSQLVDVSLTTGKKKAYAGHFWKQFSDPNSVRFFADGFEFQYVLFQPELDLVVVHLACVRGDAYDIYKNPTQDKFVLGVEAVVRDLMKSDL